MKDRLVRIAVFIRTWALRLLPVLGFAVLGGFLAIQIDRHFVNEASGESYLNYVSFNVPNAREGEDVFFTVCREHKDNYNFKGNLDIYYIKGEDDKPVPVFARDIQGSIINDCDQKVIKASDFHHTPNVYEMSFCVDFFVKYNIKKTVCKTSNRYRIYAQPNDLSSQINKAEALLEELRQRQNDSNALRDTSGQPSSLNTQTQSQSQTMQPTTPAPAQETATTPPPPASNCLIDTNLLFILPVKIAC